jgi:hypothetical protein
MYTAFIIAILAILLTIIARITAQKISDEQANCLLVAR